MLNALRRMRRRTWPRRGASWIWKHNTALFFMLLLVATVALALLVTTVGP